VAHRGAVPGELLTGDPDPLVVVVHRQVEADELDPQEEGVAAVPPVLLGEFEDRTGQWHVR
jgi:hypothetical protein